MRSIKHKMHVITIPIIVFLCFSKILVYLPVFELQLKALPTVALLDNKDLHTHSDVMLS